jgi:hypothetical protein
VLTRRRPRRPKDGARRRRQLKRLWQRLKALQQMPRLSRDQLRLKLGAARRQAPAAWRLVDLRLRERPGAGHCGDLWF